MKIEIAKKNIVMISRQRNLFIVLSVVSAFACMVLSFCLLTTEQQIVMIPGISKEMNVSNKSVSINYLESATDEIIPMLVDLDYDSIDRKKEKLLNIVSTSDPRYMRELMEYFTRVKGQYKSFQLSTRFAVKRYRADSNKLTVVASGVLESRYGNQGVDRKWVNYLLSYDWVGGKLLLKEFRIVQEEELQTNGEKND
ncbi:MAG: hypothetical protein GY694_00420 [Gammaproteobacteria bacterium]|nr:hypothetical protein [Gammaproteobacteria bacterium]